MTVDIPHSSARAEEERGLSAEILAALAEGPDGETGIFERLSPQVFAYQYANNDAYRGFCDAAGVRPPVLGKDWREIPAYPTDAFKREIVTSFPVSEAVLAQITSGTTSANQRGRIFRDEIGRELVFTANRVMTGAYLFPDFAAGRRCRILILAPSPALAPSMGMAIGMEQTRLHFGTPESAFLVGRSGVDVKGLLWALREAEASGEPVALIGATAAFVYFFNACRRKGLRFRLPPGSRLADGGGYRGRFGVVTRDDYYALAEDVLGVPGDMCANVLGMAESATNYIDDSIRRHLLGGHGERRKVCPPWTRVVAVDPETSELLPDGATGLLRHYDLVNLPTVLGVQTDNLGYTDGHGGFEIVGRAKVTDGRVDDLPSERSVGPMGDRRVFRLLEAYVNFSIDFKMGRVRAGDAKASYEELRREADARDGVEASDPVASCPIVVEDMVAAAEDPDAQTRVDVALEAYGAQALDAGARGDARGDADAGEREDAEREAS